MNQIVQKKLVAMQIEISMRLSDFKRSRFFRALSDDRYGPLVFQPRLGNQPDSGNGLESTQYPAFAPDR